MALTHKDINLLSQKSSVAGTEKLPVSDTEFITPNQIAALAGGGGGGGGEENVIEVVKVNGTALTPDANKAVDVPVPVVDSELDRTSVNTIQNKTVTLSIIDVDYLTPSSTVTGKYFTRTGTEATASNYNYRLFSVSPGRFYAVSSALGTGYTTGVLRVVIWLDSNGDVIGESQYANNSGETMAYVNSLLVSPPGAVTAAVNYRPAYTWAGKLGMVAYESNAYVGAFAQTITSAGQAQARTNIGAEASANKVTSLSSSSTDTEYPSAKCVYDLVGDIETLLAAI